MDHQCVTIGPALQGGMSTTARLQSIIPNRGGGRGLQHAQDSSHGLGAHLPHGRHREESHQLFGPNFSDSTTPVLIDMGFHK